MSNPAWSLPPDYVGSVLVLLWMIEIASSFIFRSDPGPQNGGVAVCELGDPVCAEFCWTFLRWRIACVARGPASQLGWGIRIPHCKVGEWGLRTTSSETSATDCKSDPFPCLNFPVNYFNLLFMRMVLGRSSDFL